jgi:hypothetical protein
MVLQFQVYSSTKHFSSHLGEVVVPLPRYCDSPKVRAHTTLRLDGNAHKYGQHRHVLLLKVLALSALPLGNEYFDIHPYICAFTLASF